MYHSANKIRSTHWNETPIEINRQRWHTSMDFKASSVKLVIFEADTRLDFTTSFKVDSNSYDKIINNNSPSTRTRDSLLGKPLERLWGCLI